MSRSYFSEIPSQVYMTKDSGRGLRGIRGQKIQTPVPYSSRARFTRRLFPWSTKNGNPKHQYGGSLRRLLGLLTSQTEGKLDTRWLIDNFNGPEWHLGLQEVSTRFLRQRNNVEKFNKLRYSTEKIRLPPRPPVPNMWGPIR